MSKLTSAKIAHARLVGHHPYRLHQPLFSKLEGAWLVAIIVMAYVLAAWADSGGGIQP